MGIAITKTEPARRPMGRRVSAVYSVYDGPVKVGEIRSGLPGYWYVYLGAEKVAGPLETLRDAKTRALALVLEKRGGAK